MKCSLLLKNLLLVTMIGLYRVSAAPALLARRSLHQSSKSFKSAVDGITKAPRGGAKVASPKAVTEASALNKVLSFPKNNPFAFQMIVATLKTSAADLMTQMVVEGKKFSEVDFKRNGIFVVFGFAYLGGFQWWIMVNKYRQWFPTMDRFAKLSFAEKLKDKAGIIDAGRMVLFDIFVHLPLMYFPTYYTVKEFVSGSSWNPVDWAKDGVTKYAGNAKDDLTAMVKLWGPADCVQFVLPLHIRMPFRHFVSFFWTAYVSFTRGKVDPDVVPPLE